MNGAHRERLVRSLERLEVVRRREGESRLVEAEERRRSWLSADEEHRRFEAERTKTLAAIGRSEEGPGGEASAPDDGSAVPFSIRARRRLEWLREREASTKERALEAESEWARAAALARNLAIRSRLLERFRERLEAEGARDERAQLELSTEETARCLLDWKRRSGEVVRREGFD